MEVNLEIVFRLKVGDELVMKNVKNLTKMIKYQQLITYPF